MTSRDQLQAIVALRRVAETEARRGLLLAERSLVAREAGHAARALEVSAAARALAEAIERARQEEGNPRSVAKLSHTASFLARLRAVGDDKVSAASAAWGALVDGRALVEEARASLTRAIREREAAQAEGRRRRRLALRQRARREQLQIEERQPPRPGPTRSAGPDHRE